MFQVASKKKEIPGFDPRTSRLPCSALSNSTKGETDLSKTCNPGRLYVCSCRFESAHFLPSLD